MTPPVEHPGMRISVLCSKAGIRLRAGDAARIIAALGSADDDASVVREGWRLMGVDVVWMRDIEAICDGLVDLAPGLAARIAAFTGRRDRGRDLVLDLASNPHRVPLEPWSLPFRVVPRSDVVAFVATRLPELGFPLAKGVAGLVAVRTGGLVADDVLLEAARVVDAGAAVARDEALVAVSRFPELVEGSKAWAKALRRAAVGRSRFPDLYPTLDALCELIRCGRDPGPESPSPQRTRAFRDLLMSNGIPFFVDQLDCLDVIQAVAGGDHAEAAARLGAHMGTRIREALSASSAASMEALERLLRVDPPAGLSIVRSACPPGAAAAGLSDLVCAALDADDACSASVADALTRALRAEEDERLRARTAIEVARRAREAWLRSLIGPGAARRALGVSAREFDRLLAAGRVSTAAIEPDELVRGGRLFDPVVLAALVGDVPGWRRQLALEVSARRRAAASTAEAVARRERRNVLRRRRLLAVDAGLADLAPDRWPIAAVEIVLDEPGIGVRVLCVGFAIPAEALKAADAAFSGTRRREAARCLAEAAAAVRRSTTERVDAVIAAWRARCASVVRGSEEDALTFQAMLVDAVTREIPEMAWSRRDSEHVVGRLSAALDRALAAAVTRWSAHRGRREVRLASGIDDYPAAFPVARAAGRRLLLRVGPTNSGKTHGAMEMLRGADSGCYLAPLRLMALEGADRLNAAGVPTSMVTGEERVPREGARHVSSTIETVDLSTPVDVAVVDEVQLVADPSRGWAWTQALIGVPARLVVMTGSADAIPFVSRIAEMTGEPLEIETFERLSPLDAQDRPVDLADIRAGDAVVAFTRVDVLRLRAALVRRGWSVACIYGALGPEVRRTESARFRSGEADVLVATDAVGMGLNLPIRRVVFSALQKFDGRGRRSLTPSEIRQIAGRAGRYGLAERGLAAVMVGLDPVPVSEALRGASYQPEDDRLPVMPPWAAVEAVSRLLGTQGMRAILDYCGDTLFADDARLRTAYLDAPKAVASFTEGSGLSLRTLFGYLGVPFDGRGRLALREVSRWAKVHAAGGEALPPEPRLRRAPGSSDELARCEEDAKRLTTYLWLSERWPEAYPHAARARDERDMVNGLIEAALAQKASRSGPVEADPRWARLVALRVYAQSTSGAGAQ